MVSKPATCCTGASSKGSTLVTREEISEASPRVSGASADHAPAGFLDRGQNGVLIEWTDGAQIDQLYRRVGLFGRLAASTTIARHRLRSVPSVTTRAFQWAGCTPRWGRVPESAVDPFGFEENHWLRLESKRSTVPWRRTAWRASPPSNQVGERKWLLVHRSKVPGHESHHQAPVRSSEPKIVHGSASGTVRRASSWVVGRAHEPFKLQLGNGSHAVHGKPNRTADDSRFGQRGIHHPVRSKFRLQASVARNTPPLIPTSSPKMMTRSSSRISQARHR